jgi:hypothetical protein
VVRGMTSFLANGYEGTERSDLRTKFEDFCDRVGLVNHAVKE